MIWRPPSLVDGKFEIDDQVVERLAEIALLQSHFGNCFICNSRRTGFAEQRREILRGDHVFEVCPAPPASSDD
ncbi:hypothetical protein DBR17_13470 [Sphingomonas sp. HMWF008]|nr:hypothetical protein DBR17_13470 [Sphingomonas sp. HMWF008]